PRQNGSCALIIACNRDAFAASDVFAVAHADDNDARFCAAAARNPKCVLERPEFFLGFDFQSGQSYVSSEVVPNNFRLNSDSARAVSGFTMTKLIALVAAGAFAAGTMFAGEHGDCAAKAGSEGKMACMASFASLSLTPDQKTKVAAAMTEHHKTGCTEA